MLAQLSWKPCVNRAAFASPEEGITLVLSIILTHGKYRNKIGGQIHSSASHFFANLLH